jgi:hypothetical protein
MVIPLIGKNRTARRCSPASQTEHTGEGGCNVYRDGERIRWKKRDRGARASRQLPYPHARALHDYDCYDIDMRVNGSVED